MPRSPYLSEVCKYGCRSLEKGVKNSSLGELEGKDSYICVTFDV